MLRIVCAIALLLLAQGIARCDEPSAASAAFTSNDPTVQAVLQRMEAGDFAGAEHMLQQAESPVAETRRAQAELLDIVGRIRYEYSLSPAQLLGKVKKIVPSATAEDVDRWAVETNARFRMIDGQKMYFRREPQNIFLFSDDAKRCRLESGNQPTSDGWKLTDHLAEIIREAESSGQSLVAAKRHRVVHTLTIKPGPHLKAGSQVRVWLPYAQEYRQQQNVRLISASPEPKLVAPSAIDGQPMTGAAQRTVYFETTVTDATKPLSFREEFEYLSYAYYPILEEGKVQPLPDDWHDQCLKPRPPHIVFAPEIVKQVSEIIGTEQNPLRRARMIFRWVSVNVPWNAEDEYCTIPSLALKGFRAKRGDCGVQNTLLITMCRIAGIPARWQSGFETKPGENWGMHDWAEIYIAPWGWLPADASYGVMKSSDPRIADFYCGHQDSYRLIVNLDWGRELHPPKTSLRSEPADFQRGEVEIDGRNLYYDQWTTKTEVER